MRKFKITIILNNGIADITISKFSYRNESEFYKNMCKLRSSNEYLKFEIDNKVIEYRFNDISCIKIERV